MILQKYFFYLPKNILFKMWYVSGCASIADMGFRALFQNGRRQKSRIFRKSLINLNYSPKWELIFILIYIGWYKYIIN